MNPFTGIYGLLGAAAVAALLAGGASYWVTSRGYQVEVSGLEKNISDLKLKQTQADLTSTQLSLKQLQDFISSMNAAGARNEAQDAAVARALASIHKDFLNAIKSTPLPADCKPDDARVRSLSSAIDASNSATAGPTSGTTVRTPPEAN